ALYLLELAQGSSDYKLMLKLGLHAINNQDKELHSLGVRLVGAAYPNCTVKERIKVTKAISGLLSKCGYGPIPVVLNFVKSLLASPLDDQEWRFVEGVVASS